MKKNTKIAVVGDGGWGTTLAILLAKKGHKVSLWGAFPEYVDLLNKKRENIKYLPSIKIPSTVHIASDINSVVADARIVVLAVPSHFMREVLKSIKSVGLSDPILLSVTKGIENETLMRMSEVIKDVIAPLETKYLTGLGKLHIAVLSGPSIAFEVAREVPTTVVVSSVDEKSSEEVQKTFMTERFRIYTNSDVIGVELGGSLKNIIAIAAGISDGLDFGTNTKAALLARGLVEIIRLGVKMGADPQTFNGLSGMGDLVTTCISPYGRNRWLGEQIGKGKKLAQILEEMEMVAEGVRTTKSVYELASKFDVEMPITKEVYSVLYEEKDPLQAVNDLMTRERKQEF